MKVIGLVVALAAAVAALVFRPRAAEPSFVPANPSTRHSVHARGLHTAAPVDVYVAGAVAKPGVYAVAGNARVIDALHVAGGMRGDADPDSINLAAHVSDGEKISVETREQRTAREVRALPHVRKTSTAAKPRSARRTLKSAISVTDTVDINAATVDEIARLPGVGMRLAHRIVDFRTLNGPFDSLDDLADIDGITDRTIEGISPYVVVQ